MPTPQEQKVLDDVNTLVVDACNEAGVSPASLPVVQSVVAEATAPLVTQIQTLTAQLSTFGTDADALLVLAQKLIADKTAPTGPSGGPQ